jgi:hypothetical protein
MKKKFKAVIQACRGGGACVTVPFDVEKEYGQKRVKIKAFIDGEPYRGLLVRMGGPDHVLGVLKGIREKIGKEVGDTVSVVIEPDTKLREISLPEDFVLALKKDEPTRAFFDSLSYTNRKEYVVWIEAAKRPETRQRRLQTAIEMLQQKRKTR